MRRCDEPESERLPSIRTDAAKTMSERKRTFEAHDPATGDVVWRGDAADEADVNAAVSAAREAFETWGITPLQERIATIESFGRQVQARRGDLIEAICKSTGKPRWES